MANDIRTDSIFLLLHKRHPEVEEYKNALKGQIQGENAIVPTINQSYCKSALEDAIRLCDEKLPILKRKIKRNRSWNLFGQIFTGLNSAAVLALLMKNMPFYAFIPSLLGILGSLISIVVTFTNQSIDGVQKNDGIFMKLLNLKAEAEQKRRLLSFVNEPEISEAKPQFINEINALCHDIIVIFHL